MISCVNAFEYDIGEVNTRIATIVVKNTDFMTLWQVSICIYITIFTALQLVSLNIDCVMTFVFYTFFLELVDYLK